MDLFYKLITLLIFNFVIAQNPLGLTYLDKNCYKLQYDAVWFEVDISPKYQRNCQMLHHWIPIVGKDTLKQTTAWYNNKSCLRDSKSCCLFCRQYCTDYFRVQSTNDIREMVKMKPIDITSTMKERDYLYVAPNIGTNNFITVDLRQGLRSMFIPMNNLHPDDQNFREVFQIKMTESIVNKILNNTKLYKKDAQTIQSNEHALGIDKICLLANDVLRTANMQYDFSRCFKLIPFKNLDLLGCDQHYYDRDRGYYCAGSKTLNAASQVASCIQNLPLINASKMAYNNKALEYMRTAVVAGISAIPYAGLILAATTNAILGPTADEMILNEYKDAEFNEKLVILNGVRKQVLKESANLAKGYIKDHFGDLIKKVKNVL